MSKPKRAKINNKNPAKAEACVEAEIPLISNVIPTMSAAEIPFISAPENPFISAAENPFISAVDIPFSAIVEIPFISTAKIPSIPAAENIEVMIAADSIEPVLIAATREEVPEIAQQQFSFIENYNSERTNQTGSTASSKNIQTEIPASIEEFFSEALTDEEFSFDNTIESNDFDDKNDGTNNEPWVR